jgi:Na+/H+-dicarboxylate symporter
MMQVMTNVTGDAVVTATVANLGGMLDKKKY